MDGLRIQGVILYSAKHTANTPCRRASGRMPCATHIPWSRNPARHAMHCTRMQGVLLRSAKYTGKTIAPKSIMPHGTRISSPWSRNNERDPMHFTRIQGVLLHNAKRIGKSRAEEHHAALHAQLILLAQLPLQTVLELNAMSCIRIK